MRKVFGYVIMSEQKYDGMVRKEERLAKRANALALAALDFINKVDTGRAFSKDSYAKFKKALGE